MSKMRNKNYNATNAETKPNSGDI